jgi:hypothetical protein
MMLSLDRSFGSLIKVLSIVLITSALGLELWNLAVQDIYGLPNHWLKVVFAVGRFALICHGIEGAISAFYASSRNQAPVKYSIYTFFVGTIGLVELFKQPKLQA